MNIGFVGVGAIATAFVKGLVAAYGDEVQVFLSPRNRDNAAQLQAAFPQVRVMASNQEVLDNAEWVVLSVVPTLAPAVVRELSFRRDHKVISFVVEFALDDIRAAVGEVASVTRMIPLPFVEYRVGPIVVCPATEEVTHLFGALGTLVGVDSEAELDVLFVDSALMCPFYAILGEVLRWNCAQGLSDDVSAQYAISLFEALVFRALRLPADEVVQLWHEDMTKGGLNEMAVRSLEQDGAIKAWPEAMDKVLARLRSK